MVHLSTFESGKKPINIVSVGVEHAPTKFEWKPEEYIDHHAIRELMDDHVFEPMYHGGIPEAFLTMHKLAVLFPYLRESSPLNLTDFQTVVQQLETEMAQEEESVESALGYGTFLATARTFFPKEVQEIADNEPRLAQLLRVSIMRLSSRKAFSSNAEVEAWKNAAWCTIALGESIQMPPNVFTEHPTIAHVEELQREKWWERPSHYVPFLQDILPLRLLCEYNIERIRPEASAWQYIRHTLEQLKIKSKRMLLEEVFGLSLLLAYKVTTDKNGLHIVLPVSPSEVKDAPPPQRSF